MQACIINVVIKVIDLTWRGYLIVDAPIEDTDAKLVLNDIVKGNRWKIACCYQFEIPDFWFNTFVSSDVNPNWAIIL